MNLLRRLVTCLPRENMIFMLTCWKNCSHLFKVNYVLSQELNLDALIQKCSQLIFNPTGYLHFI